MKHTLAVSTLIAALIMSVTAYANPCEEAYQQKDWPKALRECRRLADKGSALATHFLYMMYADGNGVKQDFVEAEHWLRKGAERGNAWAQFELGLMYHLGQNVPQNFREAAKWYRKAADQGNASAQNNLAYFYITGQGVPQNYVLAHMWLNLAAAEGKQTAATYRDSIAKKMNATDIAKAQQLAREWWAKHGKK